MDSDRPYVASAVACVVGIIFVTFLIGIALGLSFAFSIYTFIRFLLSRSRGAHDDGQEPGDQRRVRTGRNSPQRPSGEVATEVQEAWNRIIPVLIYGSFHDSISSSSTCAVCLDDFRNGESCRVFPPCRHLFHTLCIDPWLKGHQTCPICRYFVMEV